MSQIIITKAKLLKGDKVEIEYLQKESQESKPASCSYEHDAPPRKQFKDAFAVLPIHAALLGEFIPLTKVKDIKDKESAKDFNVTGFTIIAEGEDDEGVILSAHKTLRTGKAMGFNVPLTRFNDDSETAYPHMDELKKAINECKDEVTKYLNGEYAEDPQGKLFEKENKK